MKAPTQPQSIDETLDLLQSQNYVADRALATVLFLAMVQGMVMQGLAIDDFSSMPALAHRLFGLFRHSLGASSCA